MVALADITASMHASYAKIDHIHALRSVGNFPLRHVCDMVRYEDD